MIIKHRAFKLPGITGTLSLYKEGDRVYSIKKYTKDNDSNEYEIRITSKKGETVRVECRNGEYHGKIVKKEAGVITHFATYVDGEPHGTHRIYNRGEMVEKYFIHGEEIKSESEYRSLRLKDMIDEI